MATRQKRSGNRIAGGNPALNRARDHKAMERANEAYRLWLRGWSYARIANELGYANKGAAYKAWERARKQLSQPVDVLAERDRERERLEIAYAGIAERIEQGNDWAIDRALGIAQRKAALLGLDSRDGLGAGMVRAKRVTLVDASEVEPPPAPSTGDHAQLISSPATEVRL